MEVMKVGVVKARHDKGVAVIDDFSSVAAQSFGHGFEGPGPENAVAPDGHGPRCGLVGSTREQGGGNEDSIGRAVSCHGASPSEGERRSGRPTREGQPGFQMQYTS